MQCLPRWDFYFDIFEIEFMNFQLFLDSQEMKNLKIRSMKIVLDRVSEARRF